VCFIAAGITGLGTKGIRYFPLETQVFPELAIDLVHVTLEAGKNTNGD